jgi:hypothetical protein
VLSLEIVLKGIHRRHAGRGEGVASLVVFIGRVDVEVNRSVIRIS